MPDCPNRLHLASVEAWVRRSLVIVLRHLVTWGGSTWISSVARIRDYVGDTL